jgi:protein involved in polysaccharide export with SLBB domain
MFYRKGSFRLVGRVRCHLAGAALCVTGLVHSASGQAAAPAGSRDLEDRAALETQAANAEAQHRTAEAWLLRSRLQRGDFQDGDRIVVRLLGSVTFSDTITVRAGKMLPLPKMTDLPLDGVLRSELNARLSSHLAKYLRDSSAQATPLLRLAVLGAVRAPGYYYTSADVLLSDVIMKAGGPAPNADLGKMQIRRAGDTIWSAQDTRTAVSDGLSLDRLHLRAGDELYIGEERQVNWPLILQVGGTLLGLAFALTRLN